MTISHVIYLEFARLIVSWQWVTEVVSWPGFDMYPFGDTDYGLSCFSL